MFRLYQAALLRTNTTICPFTRRQDIMCWFPACNRQAHAPHPSESNALTRPTSFQPTRQIFALVQIWATVTRQSSRLSVAFPLWFCYSRVLTRVARRLHFQMGKCCFHQRLKTLFMNVDSPQKKQLSFSAKINNTCYNTYCAFFFTELVKKKTVGMSRLDMFFNDIFQLIIFVVHSSQ